MPTAHLRAWAPIFGAWLVVATLQTAQAGTGDGRVPFGAGAAVLHHPRYHAYRLEHVKIRVNLDETHGSLTGDVTNVVTVLHDLTSWIDFDSDGLLYSWVGIAGGSKLKYQTFGQTLRVLLPTAAPALSRYAVEARYSASPKLGIYFFLPDKVYPNRPTEIWTAGEPDSNRHWFPTYDWPDEKATTETITTVPEGQTVVSNGRLVSVTHDRAHHSATFTWTENVPHSTYLTAIYAGYFDHISTHAGDVPISYYAARGSGLAAADNWRMTPDAVEFFERFNGVPYPWEKYAEVGIESDSFGSLENVSATMLGGKRHDRRAELDGFAGGGVAHELSHQWWGDDETCADWGQLWLNEGYATYYEALYRRHALGDDAFAMDMHRIAAGALGQDVAYRRPIVTESYGSPMDMFDGTTYEKGAVVLHMLNVMLGDAMYRKGQTAFLKTYATKPADTSEWESAFEHATGRDLSWFVNEWLYRAGYPEYDVRWRADHNTGYIHIHVDQTQSAAWNTPTVFSMPVPVEVLYGDGRRFETTVSDSARSQDFTIPAHPASASDPASRAASVIFDANGAVFAAVIDHASPTELRFRMDHAAAMIDRLDASEELPQTPANLPSLAAFIVRERNVDERAEVLGTLNPSKAGARPLLLHYFDAGPPQMRTAAAQALSEAPADAATIAALVRHAAYDPSYATMAAAITSLGKLQIKSAHAMMLSAAANDEATGEIASAALGALARIDGRAAIPLLERYARYGAPDDSRPAAVRALARAGRKDREAASFVAGLLQERDLAIKFAAAGALGRMGVPSAVVALQRELLTSPDYPFYRTIVQSSIASLRAESRRGPTNRAP
ncbi:MAG TPA: M1 family aminopeptidase [Candidatus Eremiobacteraceae bacterium]